MIRTLLMVAALSLSTTLAAGYEYARLTVLGTTRVAIEMPTPKGGKQMAPAIATLDGSGDLLVMLNALGKDGWQIVSDTFKLNGDEVVMLMRTTK